MSEKNISIPKSLVLKSVEDRALAWLLHNSDELADLKPDSYFQSSLNKSIFNALHALKGVALTKEAVLSRLSDEYHKDFLKFYELSESLVRDKATFITDLALLRENDFLVNVYRMNESLNLSIPNIKKDDAINLVLDWKKKLDMLEKYSVGIAKPSMQPVSAFTQELLEDLEIRSRNPGKLLGYSTGISMLDDYTLGLIPTNLIIVAGRPGAGKTAFAGTLIRNYILNKEEKPLLFFSLEMTKWEITQRLVSSLARVKFSKLRAAILTKEEWLRVFWATQLLNSSNLEVDDTSGISIDYIENTVSERKDTGMVCIDYLQLVGAKAPSKREEVSKVSETCKQVAKRSNIPVVGLAQINRTGEADRNNRRPSIAHLKESGSLEQDADLILMLYRDKYYTPNTPFGDVAEVIIGKQRNGQVGTVFTLFLDEYVSFESLRF